MTPRIHVLALLHQPVGDGHIGRIGDERVDVLVIQRREQGLPTPAQRIQLTALPRSKIAGQRGMQGGRKTVPMQTGGVVLACRFKGGGGEVMRMESRWSNRSFH